MSDACASGSAARRVILCADDFGLTEAGCESTLDLMSGGAISAASCVVDGPCVERHAGALRKVAPPAALGLHFNLTQCGGASQRATLHAWLLRAYLLRSIDARALRHELRRQLQLFETLFQRAPAYVDGHEHVHQFPGIAEVLVEELLRHYGTSVAVRSTVTLRSRGIKARVIASLGAVRLQKVLQANRIPSNGDFAGVYDFSTRVPYGERMYRWVESIADGGLIMCHPERPSAGNAARSAEHAFLSSPTWPALLTECQLRLVPFATTNDSDRSQDGDGCLATEQ
jgi:chitin disaccharide deacetylase